MQCLVALKYCLILFFQIYIMCLLTLLSQNHRLLLDGCIVWNAHNTVFGWKATCVQAVYFLHSMMPSVTVYD